MSEGNKGMLMVKRNYAAWNISSEKFNNEWSHSKKLKFFASYAVLAPSGHNTQPWQLLAQKSSMLVSINRAHHLSIDGSGLLSVEPYISLGTFLEVFSMAARGFGYELTIKTFPKTNYIAQINIKQKVKAEPQLLKAIVERVSNRNTFQKTPIKTDLLTAIYTNRLLGVKTTPVTNREDIRFVATETEAAIESIMSNPKYRKELSLWVRTNHTSKFDGMPGFTHGFGNVKSLVAKVAVRHAPKHGPQAKKSGELIRNSGALVIVCCTDNNKESFINAGRVFSQICVLAQNAGLATSALGASVLDPATRKNVKKHFQIKDRPIYIIRLGKAKTIAKHSPRWPLEKILSHAVD